MKKRILSILLSLCMLCSLFPVTAGASETHTNHCVCGDGTCNVGDHSHSTLSEWKKLSLDDESRKLCVDGIALTTTYVDAEQCYSLTSGSYYLADSFTLENSIYVPVGNTVTICLNGRTLTSTVSGSDGAILTDGTLNLCDCIGGGALKSSAYGVYVNAAETTAGSFAMYGGTISNGSGSYQSGVFLRRNASNATPYPIFTMYGGTISGFKGSGVEVSDYGIFTMHGGTITGNTKSGYGGGVYVGSNAVFTMKNGTISNNSSSNSGGGVYARGIFTMENGEIKNNTSSNNYGGGVYVDSDQTFTMKDGSITNNTANSGGGVYISSGTFVMEKGSITGNTALYNGGGVYNGGDMTISGTAAIKDNVKNNSGNESANNVYLGYDKTITIGDSLSEGAGIGVTMGYPPSEGNPKDITGSNSADYSSYFFADDPNNYHIENTGEGNSQVVRLAVRTASATHEHNWTYAAEDKDDDVGQETIVATCSGGGTCEATNKELTIVAPLHEQVNDGKAPEATFANNATSVGGVDPLPAIMYQQTATNYPYDPIGAPTATPPTGAGRFEASITVEGVKASVVYIIKKLDRESIKQFAVSDITNNSFVITLDEADWGKTDFVCQISSDYIDFTPDANGKATITVPEAYAGSGNLWVYVYQKETDTHKKSNTKDATVSRLPADPTTYTVTFDANGATNGTVPTDSNSPYNSGATVTVLGNTGNLEKTDHTFAGWNTEADGSGITYAAGKTFTISANTTLYAKWTANTYKVTFNANGGAGTMAEQSFTHGEAAKALNANAFTRADHIFTGWNTAANGSGTAYADEASVSLSGNLTLYAQWTEVHDISGKVEGENRAGIGNITVKLVQGSRELQTATTSTEEGSVGTFTFTAVPLGSYNVVAAQEQKTKTELVIIEHTDATLTITMPNENVSSKLEVSSGTPDVVVGGLDDEAVKNADDNDSTHVSIGMSIQSQEAATEAGDAKTQQEAIKEVAGDAQADNIEFLDIKVQKTTTTNGNSATTTITDTRTVLELIIPYNMTGKHGITVYRYHDGRAEAFRKLNEKPTTSTKRDGTFWLDETNHFIYTYTNQFSTYAIGYTEPGSAPTPSTGGGGSAPTYTISVETAENGIIQVDRTKASAGTTVTLSAVPDDGYVLDTLAVTDSKGNALTVTDKGDGTCFFKMPRSNVTVTAAFSPYETEPCPKDETCPMAAFSDLTLTAWYHDGVHYCLEHDIMNGMGKDLFAPAGTTTRAQLVTMLWRLAGEPAPTGETPFTDVADGKWYTAAVLWASENALVNGYGNGAFGPNDPITREQLVAILYRYEQSLGGGFTGVWAFPLDFSDAADVSDYAYEAMCWCVMHGIITGVTDDTLVPQGDATRAQIAAIFQRYCENASNK